MAGGTLTYMTMAEEKSKIIVVDDEQEIVNTLSAFLLRKGFQVSSALNGQEALSLIEKEDADLILLDLIMPGLNGAEVAKIIKQTHPHTKVIVVTAYPEKGEFLKKESLIDGLFVKPMRIDELYAKLNDTFLMGGTLTTQQGIKTKAVFLYANLLLIEESSEISRFLEAQFKQLALKGQNFRIESASCEKEIMQKMTFSNPDIVIFNKSYYDRLDNYFTRRVVDLAKEIILFDLPAAAYNYSAFDTLIEQIRTVCVRNKLIKIIG